jgi:hypothetical protein
MALALFALLLFCARDLFFRKFRVAERGAIHPNTSACDVFVSAIISALVPRGSTGNEGEAADSMPTAL